MDISVFRRSAEKNVDADSSRWILLAKLFESLGVEKMVRDYINETATLQSGDDVAVSFTEEFPVHDLLNEVVIPILVKYFTTDDIRELTLFYKTALGAKIVDRLPRINSEILQALMKWIEDRYALRDDD